LAVINWSNVTDFGQLPSQANTASGGSFWIGMFYMLWVVLIMTFIGFGWEISLLVSSFLMLVIGLLLAYSGLVSFAGSVGFMAGVIIFMFLYIIFTSNKNTQAT
jgi:hypothetical protein